MVKLKRFFRREKGTWTLAVVTLLMAGMSLWTSNFIYQSRDRSISPFAPESESLAAGCTLNYSIVSQSTTPIPTPPCSNLDIVGISIDRSGSMQGQESDGRRKLAWAKEAAVGLVTNIQNSGVTAMRIGVNSFGAQGNTGGTLGSTYNSTQHIALSTNYSGVINAINNVVYRTSGTCIECGIRLCNIQARNSTKPVKTCILISDGKANHKWNGTTGGTPNPRQAAINEANAGRQLGVEYHVVGYGLRDLGTGPGGIDETTLRAIAGSTGSYQYKPSVQDWSSALVAAWRNSCN